MRPQAVANMNKRLQDFLERATSAQAKALHIFDFDDTLFDSPKVPKDWEGSEREWWRNPASLSPPHVPEGAEKKRVLPTAQVARSSVQNPKVHAVLLTGRADDPGMRMRIASITKALGLEFDSLFFKESGNTEQYKARVVEGLLQKMPSVQTVAMWDDLARNLNAVEKVAESAGVDFQRNLIRTAHSFAEQRQACFDAISVTKETPQTTLSDWGSAMSFLNDFKRMAQGRSLPGLSEAAKATDPMKAVKAALPTIKSTVQKAAFAVKTADVETLKVEVKFKDGEDTNGAHVRCDIGIEVVYTYGYHDRVKDMASIYAEHITYAVDAALKLKENPSNPTLLTNSEIAIAYPAFEDAEQELISGSRDEGDYELKYHFLIYPAKQFGAKNATKRN